MVLTQEKFSENNEPSTVSWLIPIAYHTREDSTPKVMVMTEESISINVDINPLTSWVKINSHSQGYYRVKYPEQMLNLLIEAAKHKELDPLDRLNLNDDLFALARAGHMSTVDYLELLMAFVDEDNYYVWKSIAYSMGSLNALLSNTNYQGKFYAFGRRLMARICKNFGWSTDPNDRPQKILLQSLCIETLGKYRDLEVINGAKRRFSDMMLYDKPLDPELKNSIYLIASYNLSDADFNIYFSVCIFNGPHVLK